MKKLFYLLILFPLVNTTAKAQDTFSIVAIDTATGEVGSAGASCINNSVIISDVYPGRGAIHTQAQYIRANQEAAGIRMISGDSPDKILKYLFEHDGTNDSSIRQYGIVDFDSLGNARSAGFSGSKCMDYKNHITGYGYAIQGNILLGQQILDSMEARFLRTKGPLSDRLMAAMQGANVPGADTRCAPKNKSSLSSFIRVANKEEVYLELIVRQSPDNVSLDPIDSLQRMYDEYKLSLTGIAEHRYSKIRVSIYPNPVNEESVLKIEQPVSGTQFTLRIVDVLGKEVFREMSSTTEWKIRKSYFKKGMHFYEISSDAGVFSTGKFLAN